MGARQGARQGGETRSKTRGETGAKWGKAGQSKIILGFRVPTTRGQDRGETRGEQGPLSHSLTSCPSWWWGPYIVAFWWEHYNLDRG